MNRAIFIDKDGTLIIDVPYNVDPGLICFEEYAFESLHILQQKGFCLVIISNQPGIELGYFKEDDLKNVERSIRESLRANDIILDGFYYCPHAQQSACACRKPAPGLLMKAAKDMDIDLTRSWMIGDILNDVEAGKRCGCKTVLINNGNETEWFLNEQRSPDFMVNHLKEAAEIITLCGINN